MLKKKAATVVTVGLVPEMFFALGIADRAYADEGLDCVVTSARDATHNPGSLHGKGYAFDLGNSTLYADQHQRVYSKLQRLERYGFDVVDEKAGDTPATTGPHFHIEFQPKPGEKFWRMADGTISDNVTQG